MTEKEILIEFGNALQQARTSAGLSQEKLAEISGLDRTYVSSVERGRRNLGLLNIHRLAEALHVSPSSLIRGEAFQYLSSNIDKAYDFYKKHIYDDEKIRLLEMNGLGAKITGSVPSVLWELFASLLTGRGGSKLTGADLQGWEVKSATGAGAYEYQYHLNTGAEKLDEDCRVNHLFFSYSPTYKDVVVRVMSGAALAEKYFGTWVAAYHANYANGKQRFRKNIPYGFVKRNGVLVLKIENGKLIEKHDHIIKKFNEQCGA